MKTNAQLASDVISGNANLDEIKDKLMEEAAKDKFGDIKLIKAVLAVLVGKMRPGTNP